MAQNEGGNQQTNPNIEPIQTVLEPINTHAPRVIPRPAPQLRSPLPFLNVAGQTRLTNGYLISPNFKTGEVGWAVDAEGNAEFNNGLFRGTFEIGGAVKTIDVVGDIQPALDDLASTGGGTVYLKAGTYVLTADISIPSGCILEGIARDSVIIDCNTSYAVKITGTDVYTAGTVTINNGDTTVTGGGTTWTDAVVGRYIWLDYYWYEITGRTNNTTITIGEAFSGGNIAGGAYVISAINIATKISRLTITNATGSGFIGAYSRELLVDDIYVYGCGIGIDLDYCLYPKIVSSCDVNTTGMNFNYVAGYYIDFNECNNNTGNGVTMTNCLNATCSNSSFDNNGGDGLNMTTCSETGFVANSYKNNGGQGIELVATCNDNQFVASVISDNTSDGIKLTATDDRNTIVGVTIANNGGYGVNITAATCDNNQIIAPAFDTNTSGNINDAGTNTFVSPQQVGSNMQTFNADGTWTKPSSGTMALIQVWGGGGSGNIKNNPSSGGGGGAYMELLMPLTSLGATEAVVVGLGGAGVTGTKGNDGGTSSFGTTKVVALGGGGATNGVAGAGGVTTGATHYNGALGGLSNNTAGSVIWGGGGGAGDNAGTPGTAGTSKLGGNGGASNSVGIVPSGGGGGWWTGTSGAGGKGRVIVTTF